LTRFRGFRIVPAGKESKKMLRPDHPKVAPISELLESEAKSKKVVEAVIDRDKKQTDNSDKIVDSLQTLIANDERRERQSKTDSRINYLILIFAIVSSLPVLLALARWLSSIYGTFH
jgi:excinuclease UvrABC ATPase subunit